MDNQKLRLKVGPHEFDAEGPPETVSAQFEAWKQLITAFPAGRELTPPKPSKLSNMVEEVQTKDGRRATWDIFDVEDERKLVTLSVHPTGEKRDADAVLLWLFGFRQAFQLNEVPVTRLIQALEISGLRPARIDRALGPHLREGLVLKGGHGKGGKYRLTNTGLARAEELARVLFEQLV